MNFNWESIILNAIILVAVGVLGFLLKRSINQIDHRLEQGDKKFLAICEDINRLKENRGYDREYYAKEYVAKEDYLRVMTSVEQKLEAINQSTQGISQKVTKMEEKISSLEACK